MYKSALFKRNDYYHRKKLVARSATDWLLPPTGGAFRHRLAIATDRWRVQPQTGYCHRPVARSATDWLLPPTGGAFSHRLAIATDRWHVQPQTGYCHRQITIKACFVNRPVSRFRWLSGLVRWFVVHSFWVRFSLHA